MAAATKNGEFGYGDPLADVGTDGWARRVRVVLLSAVDGAQFRVHNLRTVLEQFLLNHGWRLLDTQHGRRYVHFRDFVQAPKPWGLGTNYERFRSLVASEIGEREFDRLTASESVQGERSDLTSCSEVEKLSRSERQRSFRLRAINRAPVVIRQLYDQDLLAVDLAAKFGPLAADDEQGLEVREDMERRAHVLQDRHEAIRVFQPDMPPRKVKQEMNRSAREVLELKPPDMVEQALAIFRKMTAEERECFKARIATESD